MFAERGTTAIARRTFRAMGYGSVDGAVPVKFRRSRVRGATPYSRVNMYRSVDRNDSQKEAEQTAPSPRKRVTVVAGGGGELRRGGQPSKLGFEEEP